VRGLYCDRQIRRDRRESYIEDMENTHPLYLFRDERYPIKILHPQSRQAREGVRGVLSAHIPEQPSWSCPIRGMCPPTKQNMSNLSGSLARFSNTCAYEVVVSIIPSEKEGAGLDSCRG
jgi:hypothetical protein